MTEMQHDRANKTIGKKRAPRVTMPRKSRRHQELRDESAEMLKGWTNPDFANKLHSVFRAHCTPNTSNDALKRIETVLALDEGELNRRIKESVPNFRGGVPVPNPKKIAAKLVSSKWKYVLSECQTSPSAASWDWVVDTAQEIAKFSRCTPGQPERD